MSQTISQFTSEPDSQPIPEPVKPKKHEPPSQGVLFQKKIKQAVRVVKARAMADARGGACLSLKAPAHCSTLEWKCADGHIWKNTYCMILCENFWCPNCPLDDHKALDAVLAKYLAALNSRLEAGDLRKLTSARSSDEKKSKV